jgi:hypothetical protein
MMKCRRSDAASSAGRVVVLWCHRPILLSLVGQNQGITSPVKIGDGQSAGTVNDTKPQDKVAGQVLPTAPPHRTILGLENNCAK